MAFKNKILIEPFSTYLSRKQCISPSAFKNVSCPKEFWYNHHNPKPITNATILGSAFHTLFSDPEDFSSLYSVLSPEDLPSYPNSSNFTNKRNKRYRDEFIQKNKLKGKETLIATTAPNKYILKTLNSMKDEVLKMSIKWEGEDGAYKEEPLPELLEQGLFERSFYTKDEETGLLIRFRPDWDSEKRSMIIDFKSTLCASYENFYRDLLKYGYDMQAAFYIDFYKQITGKDATFWIPAVEKKAPFLSNLYLLDDEGIIEQGRVKYRRRLKEIAYSLKSKDFKGLEVNNNTGLGYSVLRRPDFDYYQDKQW